MDKGREVTMTEVLDLSTGKWRGYCLDPVQAVIAAYAQVTKGDWSTWNYEKYIGLVKSTDLVVSCGDMSAVLPRFSLFGD